MSVHRSGTAVPHPPQRRPRRALTTAAAALLAVLSPLLLAPSPAGATGSGDGDFPPRGSAHLGMGVIEHDGQGGLPPLTRASQTEGVDVSSHQGNVDWPALWDSGVKWSYNKATEGTYYKNPYFTQQYNGAYDIGMIRGAYHFATPDTASGTVQADYFIDHGGGWSADGRTLPGALDIEWNPYGDTCYGKSRSGMVTWIGDFLARYRARTGRDAVIYTATSWWTQCTGGYSGFGASNPLWIARYNTTPGPLPAGWDAHTMWQYTSSGPIVGDHDRFNGTLDRITDLAGN
ncbi:lysozyme [Streptomyces sp. NPDC051018]|uniref:lysozyme n=1 Tax=Streptomyces sp. NPDC051018 TaxID=3365639 RepID=UPI00378C14E3